MAKDKVTLSLDKDVIAYTDADAAATGLNRSEYIEKALREYTRRNRARKAADAAAEATRDPQLRSEIDRFSALMAPYRTAAVARFQQQPAA